jgi:hypothetical protein
LNHLLPILLGLTAALAWQAPAHAHAFGQRYDLPLPLSLFVWTGGAVVFVSFVIVALFLKHDRAPGDYPRANLLANPIGRFLAHPATLNLIRLVFFILFLVTVLAGYIGDQSPYKNISVVMVWVIAWVGLAFACSLLGDLYALINPWNTGFAWAEALFRRGDRSRRLSINLPYPQSLGAWPAFILFFVFAWMEITWPGASLPEFLAISLSAYSVITWAGMFLFGREVWLEHGEAFAIIYRLFARFAITEVRVTKGAGAGYDGPVDINDPELGCINGYGAFFDAAPTARQWNLRPPGVGLRIGNVPSVTIMFFVLLLLSTVTYDGYTETESYQRIGLFLFEQISSLGQTAIHIVETIGITTFPVLFITVYLVFALLIGLFAGSHDTLGAVAQIFILSVVPIAIAYHLAHYLSLFVFEGQMVISRLSDPFGFGWDIFGTAGYKQDLTIMNAKFVWYFSITSIVIGHIAAVYLAHAEALRLFKDRRTALISQIPMLVLMVGYTMLSLWIIAQPIVG